MSDRERWIVYPLLFLALGAALRDKLIKQTRTKQIACEELWLVDADGRTQALITGKGMKFDYGGPGNGLIQAARVDAQAFVQRGRPVGAAGPRQQITLQQLLQMLPNLRITPGSPQPDDEAPPEPNIIPGADEPQEIPAEEEAPPTGGEPAPEA